jgi:hypothetical protein
LNGQ